MKVLRKIEQNAHTGECTTSCVDSESHCDGEEGHEREQNCPCEDGHSLRVIFFGNNRCEEKLLQSVSQHRSQSIIWQTK
eukprot:scaffold11298_cov22-Prasinocladus_malaysianus.AAC.1